MSLASVPPPVAKSAAASSVRTSQAFLEDDDWTRYPVYRFTVEQYLKMAEVGILTEDDDVELLEGWIVPKMTKNPDHDNIIEILGEIVRPMLPPSVRLRGQSATTTTDSVPEPDLAVVRGSVRERRHRHPRHDETALVIEVAHSSLRRDRRKARLYARAGIPTYWIVNCVDQQIEVRTQPTGPVDEPTYGSQRDYGINESVPVVIDGVEVGSIAVAEVFQ